MPDEVKAKIEKYKGNLNKEPPEELVNKWKREVMGVKEEKFSIDNHKV